jgi:hypothetical protein
MVGMTYIFWSTTTADNMRARAYTLYSDSVVRYCLPRCQSGPIRQRICRAQAAREMRTLCAEGYTITKEGTYRG